MSLDHVKIKRALLSVTDKTGIVELAKSLAASGIELISTGGTAKTLIEAGLKVTPIEVITKNPEAFGGRMKSISFQVGSALLFRRGHDGDEAEAKALNIGPIDLVVCNLYDFEGTSTGKHSLDEKIEAIDIGGPTMIRAAAKNFSAVACLTDPNDYAELSASLKRDGGLSLAERTRLAVKAFQRIAAYDLAIASHLTQELSGPEGGKLRYGENPHQKASMIPIRNTSSTQALAQSTALQGKEISYNNWLDADAAFKCVSELNAKFEGYASVAIIKHGNPCGVATQRTGIEALQAAWNADAISAFGGILAFNFSVTQEQAEFFSDRFVEVILAPSFSEEAKQIFSKKKNLRLLTCPMKALNATEWTARSIHGGLLIQEEDRIREISLKSVTKREFPSGLRDLAKFGVIVSQYLKSNCIGLFQKLGSGFVSAASGVGQPNRLDCITRLVEPKAAEMKIATRDCVLVSDAFFPFADSIEACARLGIKTIVQPGGSVRDAEVIEMCDRHQIAMAFTGERHFRH